MSLDIEAKVKNPISIRLGENYNIILADKTCNQIYPLNPGAILGTEHYGFIVISDYNGIQREYVYPTQCRINAIGIGDDNLLRIFEENKQFSWSFHKSGKLEHSAFGEFSRSYKEKLNLYKEKTDIFLGEAKLENPINIKITNNPYKNIIVGDALIKKDYPLYPGVVLGTEHYGFILNLDTDDCKKTISYPTQNKICMLGANGGVYEDIEIFEDGKYHPWRFTYDGCFKEQASYNPYSRMDEKFIREHYDIVGDIEKCYSFKKKL